MLSITTIELSTSIPTPKASPERDIMFKLTLKNFIITKVKSIETGIETAIIKGALKSPIKKRITRNASIPPTTIV